MTEVLVEFFVDALSFLGTNIWGKNLTVFFISMMPILELRGGMIAACLMGLNPYVSLIVCILGNIIPIPLILWFIKPVFDWFKKKKFLEKFAIWCEKHAEKKQGKIDQLKYYGLFIFVAVPLPTTGAWTGSLIASLLNLDQKKSLIAIICGVIAAGLIMLFVSFGLLGGICK
ncbi:MAG: small multi-drug export protein [Firmicutes bacterium]|nr:small multi-drug export protein [Bacillota bacterium]